MPFHLFGIVLNLTNACQHAIHFLFFLPSYSFESIEVLEIRFYDLLLLLLSLKQGFRYEMLHPSFVERKIWNLPMSIESILLLARLCLHLHVTMENAISDDDSIMMESIQYEHQIAEFAYTVSFHTPQKV